MKRFFIIILLISAISIEFVNAQQWKKKRKQVCLGGGVSNFLGELGGANRIGTSGVRDLDFPSTRPAFHIGYNYRLGSWVSLKTNLYFGYVGGNDKYTEEMFRNNRNINFRTVIWELSSQFEFYILKEKEGHRYYFKGVRGWQYHQIQWYLFAGAGGFYFNPKGKIDGKFVNLKPLSTEGQGLAPTRPKYSLVQFCMPFGTGFKVAINQEWLIGIEYGVRKTFTDYIDDASTFYFDSQALQSAKGDLAVKAANPSPTAYDPTAGLYRSTMPGQQRGDPRDRDSYMFATISVYYILRPDAFSTKNLFKKRSIIINKKKW